MNAIEMLQLDSINQSIPYTLSPFEYALQINDSHSISRGRTSEHILYIIYELILRVREVISQRTSP